MTEAETIDSTTAAHDLPAAPTSRAEQHAADFAATPLRDLILTARTYYTAINLRAQPVKDDDAFTALADFDDFLVEEIAKRVPTRRDELASKAAFLLGRLQAENLSENAQAAAWEAINAEMPTWFAAQAVAS
jgi:hypothetical protein